MPYGLCGPSAHARASRAEAQPAGLGAPVIAVFAREAWKEPLTRRMLIGIGLLIILGVLLVELGQ